MPVKKADDATVKFIDKELNKAVETYTDLIENMKKRVSDYFNIRTYYFDENGRFISAKQYRKLFREGKDVEKKNIFYLKVDLPEYGLKAGDRLPDDRGDEILESIRKEIRRHNTAVTIMFRDNLTYQEARKLVDEAFDAYEKGDIDADELSDILGS